MIAQTADRGFIQATPGARLAKLPSWPAVFIVLGLPTAVVAPAGLTYAACFYVLLLAVIVWAAKGEKFDSNLLHAIVPFVLIIAIGLLGFGTDRYLYLKDAWFASNPIVVIALGYVLYRCKPDAVRGLRAFVMGGTLVGLIHLGNLAMHPELLKLSAAQIRDEIGVGYFAPVLSFTILCAYFRRWSNQLKMPGWMASVCFSICAMAIVASFSRQMSLVAVVGILAAAGGFARREWLYMGIAGMLLVTAIVSLRTFVTFNSAESGQSFLGKIARVSDEMTIQDYPDRKSIMANWRGYESSRALRSYLAGSPFELLAGRGFGTQVNLGLFIALGTGEPGERVRINYAPILHNGYAYLLVKAGPVAVALVAYALIWFYRVGRRYAGGLAGRAFAAPGRVLQAIAVTVALTTWVSMGVLSRSGMFAYLLAAGFLLAALTRGQEDPE